MGQPHLNVSGCSWIRSIQPGAVPWVGLAFFHLISLLSDENGQICVILESPTSVSRSRWKWRRLVWSRFLEGAANALHTICLCGADAGKEETTGWGCMFLSWLLSNTSCTKPSDYMSPYSGDANNHFTGQEIQTQRHPVPYPELHTEMHGKASCLKALGPYFPDAVIKCVVRALSHTQERN